MRYLTSVALLLLPLAASAEDCAKLDAKGVAALFDDWNLALSSLDAHEVSARYWPDAVLLPTQSNTPRTSGAMITDYYEHFLARRPRGRIDSRRITLGCNLAIDTGTYSFSLMSDKGAVSEVPARYSFVYQYRDGAWKILHQHSSAMPESGEASPAAESGEARAAVVVVPAPAPAAPPAPAVAAPTRVAVAKPVKPPAPPAKSAAPGDKDKSPAKEAPLAKEQAAAKPAAGKDVHTSMFANLSSSPSPAEFYPAEAKSRRERGEVKLRVCADDGGAVHGSPEVLKTSGSKRLDEAAQTWARSAKWVPATLNFKRVEGCTELNVAFEPPV